MGVQEILDIMALPPTQLKDWYLRQLVIANRLRASVNRSFGRNDLTTSSPAALPEASDIVHETCRRVIEGYNETYVWDRSVSFDKFFARCLRATCWSLRDAERRHIKGGQAIVSRVLVDPPRAPPEQDDNVANRQYAPALAAAIATKFMTGAAVRYATKLDVYALEKWSAPEIAKDLDVKQSTVESLRGRLNKHSGLRRALKNEGE
jgi:DNA-directed RNA polymerase specialized sigma24 family protein